MAAVTPWDALADAVEALHDAERHGGDVAAAQAEVLRAKEHLGALGGLLVLMALDTAGLPLQRKLAAVFDGLARDAWDKAQRAGKRATWAIQEVDVLKGRVKELEAAVAGLNGAPVLKVVG